MPKERTTSESQLGYFFECCQRWYPTPEHQCLAKLRRPMRERPNLSPVRAHVWD